jgi:DMSO/TMAO reductase YedYZ molybdopterin-dependent catalytic subunit
MIRALAAGLLALVPVTATAADTTLSVEGHVLHPLKLSAADLKTFPATELDVTFETSHGSEHGRFTGALLWAVLEQAQLADTAGKHPDLHHTLLATATDGYAIAFSFGEIDPDFGNRPIIVAYARDGKPLDGLRLVVPGDKHGARDVRDVVKIEVE